MPPILVNASNVMGCSEPRSQNELKQTSVTSCDASLKVTQGLSENKSESHGLPQGPIMSGPVLSDLTSYCFSSPFTPDTSASLLFEEHIRHAQVERNLHPLTPSLLNTLPLFAKSLTSLKFPLNHHLVIKFTPTFQSLSSHLV